MAATSSSESTMRPRHRDEDDQLLKILYNLVRDGELKDQTATNLNLESLPEALLNDRITDKDETALHIAVIYGHEHIVELLVKQMSYEGLAMHRSTDGFTALILAAVLGKCRMAECMLQNFPDLISIRDSKCNSQLPVAWAIEFRQIEMARRLYDLTRVKDLIPQDNDQKIYSNTATLLNNAIYTGTLDIALRLIQLCPRLALTRGNNGLRVSDRVPFSRMESPIYALASMRQSFSSENQLGFWKKRIYSCLPAPISEARRLKSSNREQCQSNQEDQNNRSSGLPAPLALPTGDIDDIHLNVSNGEQHLSNIQEEYQNNRSVLSTMFHYIVSGVRNFCGITQLLEMKKIHVQYNELLSQMCTEISKSDTQQREKGQVDGAILKAAENGNFVLVSKMLKADPQLLWIREKIKGNNIFMLSVLHRHEKIFSILYGLDTMKTYFTCLEDVERNNLLHLAGTMLDSTRVNQIQGIALQMQRELQWFKEVERIVYPMFRETTNELDGLTARQLFTKNHKDMMKKGEKWIKGTSSSCTVVGALIITSMFAVAFRPRPDGDNQRLFMLFIVSDALSLFSSSTSVLMFLGILTSRYAEEDFLEYLPRQMIIGLLTLFCSIATMIITFSSALLMTLHEQLHIAIPLICLVSVPVTLFVWIQFPILRDMIISTYGPGIFDKKMKSIFI